MQPGIFRTIGAVAAGEVLGRTKNAVATNIIDEASDRAKGVIDLLEKIESIIEEEEVK
jgi:hypothetical protein